MATLVWLWAFFVTHAVHRWQEVFVMLLIDFYWGLLFYTVYKLGKITKKQ